MFWYFAKKYTVAIKNRKKNRLRWNHNIPHTVCFQGDDNVFDGF